MQWHCLRQPRCRSTRCWPCRLRLLASVAANGGSLPRLLLIWRRAASAAQAVVALPVRPRQQTVAGRWHRWRRGRGRRLAPWVRLRADEVGVSRLPILRVCLHRWMAAVLGAAAALAFSWWRMVRVDGSARLAGMVVRLVETLAWPRRLMVSDACICAWGGVCISWGGAALDAVRVLR